MKNRTFSSVNARYFTAFIDLKRSLGFKYVTEEEILLSFDRFLLKRDESSPELWKEAIDQWSAKHLNETDLSRYCRIVGLIQFLSYLRDIGIKVPIPKLPKYPQSTFIPHIYTQEEIVAIFRTCDDLRLGTRNMSSNLIVMPCLIRMLYATGIRIGEALSLKNKDVNLAEKYLILRGTKNTKDRLTPFTDTLAAVCEDYLQHRNALPVPLINEANKLFFVSLRGTCCSKNNIRYWFRKVLVKAGIPLNGNGIGPRVHDIRHCFACHSFIKLADDGLDLYHSWPYLSTYLGHQSLRATERYIRLTEQLYPELLNGVDQLYIDILPSLSSIQTQTP